MASFQWQAAIEGKNALNSERNLICLVACLTIAIGGAAVALPPAQAPVTQSEVAGEVCQTAKDIERINRGIVKRVFRVTGKDAKLFLAADPALLDFEDEFQVLIAKDIDEIVVWRHTRMRDIAMAVPFASGCHVTKYGEPDIYEKLDVMRSLVPMIEKRGLDDPAVRDRLRDLATFRDRWATGRIIATPEEVKKRIDGLLAHLRQAQRSD